MSESTYDPSLPRTRRLPRIGDAGRAKEAGVDAAPPFPEMNAALRAMQAMLRPITRVLLRSGVSFGTFSEIAKQIFVEVAHAEFQVHGRKPSIAHTSVLTGLTRKEVSRRLSRALPEQDGSRYNRAVRVISGWATDPRFKDAKGPRSLLFDDGSPSFVELVREFSGDMPARSVLDELLRVGAVRKREDGRIRLLQNAYVPSDDVGEKLGILGADVADLVSCIDHNLTAAPGRAFFQRKVAYNNLIKVALPTMRAHIGQRAQALLEELNTLMSEQDRDVNQDLDHDGRVRAMVGIYYYEEDLEGEQR